MDKKFYCVVSYNPVPKTNLPGNKKNQPQETLMTFAEYQEYSQELKHRVQVVQAGLSSVGLRSAQLETQQIIELMYGIYNPEEAAKEKLTQFEGLNSQIVESEIERPEEVKADNK